MYHFQSLQSRDVCMSVNTEGFTRRCKPVVTFKLRYQIRLIRKKAASKDLGSDFWMDETEMNFSQKCQNDGNRKSLERQRNSSRSKSTTSCVKHVMSLQVNWLTAVIDDVAVDRSNKMNSRLYFLPTFSQMQSECK